MAAFKVTGVKAIDKKLKNLEPKLAKKVLRKAMRRSMKIIKKEVEQNAPRDSGAIARSVKIKSGKRSRKGMSIDVVIGEGNFKGDTFYAAMVEFGTSKQVGQGYMRAAFDSKGEQAKKIVMVEILKEIEKLVKK